MYYEQGNRIKELTNTLNTYRDAYYNKDAPLVADAVYDRLYDELAALENATGLRLTNSPTQTVGFAVVSGLHKVKHDTPLLSLEKTKSIRDILSFSGGGPIMLMHKLDGLTVKLEYEGGKLLRASTRGDGEEGEDITHNAGAIAGIPMTMPYLQRLVVTGEAYILKATFEALKGALTDSTGKPYKNARNMAAGAVRNFDSGACAKRGVRFTTFNVLEGFGEDLGYANSKSARLGQLSLFGFSICKYLLIPSPTESLLTEAKTNLLIVAGEDDVPIDGLVATFDDVAFSKSCGRTGHHYKDGMALKFEDEAEETVFRGIEWTPTRFGVLSPVALFDTVQLDGCDVSRASLHNLSIIKGMGLHPGCRILVSKRNMIIPHVEGNLDTGGFDSGLVPSTCPSCGEPVQVQWGMTVFYEKVEVVQCSNKSCPKQKLRKFAHFVGKKAMDIAGLSEATLERFIDKGWLDTFMDVYRLDAHKRTIETGMDGFGAKSWQRLWDAIQASRNTTFERYVISMDIPMIGRAASRELSRVFAGNLMAFETAVDNGFDFTTLEDFGETLHTNIHQWFKDEENRNLWEELQKMLNVKNEDNVVIANENGAFSGKTVVVTGKLELFTRASINEKIEALGAKAGSAVSGNTDYLICGEKAGSKLAKAQELGITVLTEEQFLEMASA